MDTNLNAWHWNKTAYDFLWADSPGYVFVVCVWSNVVLYLL